MSGLLKGKVTDDSKVVIGFDSEGTAEFNGKIYAQKGGTLAGWNIDDNGITIGTLG
jgi:hypothetical protein